MATKKIYKHHERTTIAAALSDAQTREIVAGSGSKEVVFTWADGSTSRLSSAVFNVKDYGAKGDGVTNDSLAIQSAVDASLAQSPAGCVYFPAGYYKVEGIIVASHVRLFAHHDAWLVPVSGADWIIRTDPADQVLDMRFSGLNFYNDDVTIPMKCIKVTQDDADPSAFANQGIYFSNIRAERYVYKGIECMGKQYGQIYIENVLMRRLVPVAILITFGGTYTNAVAGDIGKTVVGPSATGILESYDNGLKQWRVTLTTGSISAAEAITITTGTGAGTTTASEAGERDSNTFGIKATGPVCYRNIEILGSFHKGIWFIGSNFGLDGYNICGSGTLANSDDYWMKHALYIDGSKGVSAGSNYMEKYWTNAAALSYIFQEPIKITGASGPVAIKAVNSQEGSAIIDDGCFDVTFEACYFLKGLIWNKSRDVVVAYQACNNNETIWSASAMRSNYVAGITSVGPVVDLKAPSEIVSGGICSGGFPFGLSAGTDCTLTEETGAGYFCLGDRALKIVTASAGRFFTLFFDNLVIGQPYVFSAVMMSGATATIENTAVTFVNGNGIYASVIRPTTDFVAGQKWRYLAAALVSDTTTLEVKITLAAAGTAYLCSGIVSKGKYNFPRILEDAA